MDDHLSESLVDMDCELLGFGPFTLDPIRHVLYEAGEPIRLGSRALAILLVLVERAGQTISAAELLAHVWTDRVIEGGTLRVHIAALRKVLGDGRSGVRYVESVSGGGYRFAAPLGRLPQVNPPGRVGTRSSHYPTHPAQQRIGATICHCC